MEIFKKEMSDEEKQKILEMSEISLILDTYDDMFSSFDPRPYSQRALSEDFLSEAKDTTDTVCELRVRNPPLFD